MADGFAQMIDDSNAFFAELKDNNSKDWFNPRKEHYTVAIKKPAELFGDLLAEDFSRLSGTAMKPKLFRIYRDVRFSKDKTPLNAHLHMMWRAPGDDPFTPAFFFGSEPGSLVTGCGIMGLRGDALARFRGFVDTHGDELQGLLDQIGWEMSGWGEAPLKNVPKPFDKEHPHGELLKRKNLIIHAEMGDTWRSDDGGLLVAVRENFRQVLPLMELFRAI